MNSPHISPIQFVRNEDGTMGLAGHPHVRLKTHEGQGHTTGRDWQQELKLPHYFEQWEEMARVRNNDLTGRRIRFLLMDESETRLTGRPRYSPKAVAIPQVALFELAHTGFVIGLVHAFVHGSEHLRAWLPPDLEPEGSHIIAEASLFDSPLADRAWEGAQRGIFTHVCPVIASAHDTPEGGGELVQVSLVPGDYPGIPNARVLSWWESNIG